MRFLRQQLPHRGHRGAVILLRLREVPLPRPTTAVCLPFGLVMPPYLFYNDTMNWDLFTGERAGTDALLLADFAQAAHGVYGADLGCGSGILLLLLLLSSGERRMTGVDIRESAAASARKNLHAFSLGGRGSAVCADYRYAPFTDGSLDFIVSNPPYFPAGSGAVSPNADRAAQRTESASVGELCTAAARYLKSGGEFFLVHRVQREREVLAALRSAHLTPVCRRDIFSAPEKRAPVFLMKAVKDAPLCAVRHESILLRGADGRETEEYRKICHWEA